MHHLFFVKLNWNERHIIHSIILQKKKNSRADFLLMSRRLALPFGSESTTPCE
jgi:hypothetical protein